MVGNAHVIQMTMLALSCWRLTAGSVQAASPVQGVNDAGLLQLYAPVTVELPPRLLTPAVLARARAGQPTLLTDHPSVLGDAGLGQRLAAEIPEARWRDMIPPYTAFTMQAGANQNEKDSGNCPFCGRTYGGAPMSMEDFFAHPFQAKTGCCGATVYEREADMPEGYQARPNKTVTIPNLDGTQREYRFYIPPGEENQGPEIGSRRNWFCSASDVWWARYQFFQPAHQASAVSALAGAVFHANDPKAARALAVIYDRLAEVLPGYALVDMRGTANGIVRGADGKDYLTTKECRTTAVPAAWKRPGWFRTPPFKGRWEDNTVAQCGGMAAIFDLILDRPEVRAYSLERYQDELAWEKKVRKGAVGEWRFRSQCATPNRGGNTSILWIIGGQRLGLVTQDRYFVDTAIEMLDPIIDNHFFGDGLCVEGAFNYADMLGPSVSQVASLRENLGVDITPRHPLLPVIVNRGIAPFITLYGIESMHGDEHAYFFTGNGTGWKHPPAKLDYPAHETSHADPEYGLACLRAGAPGRRMETIMDFQTARAHTHNARLNIQMFYEGVNLMPDVGYACVAADVTKAPWSTVPYPFEKLPLPPGTDSWGAWFYTYSIRPEIHCTALVDGEHGQRPVTFRRFLGGDTFGEPGYNAQFLDVDGRGLFNLRAQPVEAFDRQLATVTLADGRPLTLDFFRIRGGQRHDLLWHSPATGPDDKLDTSLGEPALLSGSFNDVLNAANSNRAGKALAGNGSDLMRRLGKWDMPAGGWQTTFHIEPAHFNPVTEGGRKFYQPWIDALHNVNLRLWGTAVGSPSATQDLLCARAPWPSKIREVVDGAEISGTVSLKDAFHLFVESRTGASNDLSTTYAHVLEPFNADQPSAVQKVDVLPSDVPGQSADTSMGAGLRITLAGSNTLLAATTLDGGSFTGGGLKLTGRLGVAEPAAHRLTLFDGTAFAAGDFGVELDAGWDLELLGVIGDLTGHPGESALVVRSRRPLPTDQTLAGRTLTVAHQISSLHTTGYTIARVSAFGRGRYRIDLRNVPAFLINRLSVVEADPQNPRRFKVNYWLLKGDNEKGLYDGRRVRFPRQGFETAMTLPPSQDDWHHAHILLDRAAPRTLQVGEPVVIYQIQPGDRVVIPSHFACQGVATNGGLKVDLAATGPVTLTIPGAFANASLLMGFTKAPLTDVAASGGRLKIRLDRDDLIDGRASLLLSRP